MIGLNQRASVTKLPTEVEFSKLLAFLVEKTNPDIQLTNYRYRLALRGSLVL